MPAGLATPKPHTSDSELSAHPLAGRLVTWFTQNGGRLNPDVRIVFSESHGFHLVAVRPLASTTVASCPLQLTLSILNLDPNEKEVIHCNSPLRQCRGKLPDHIVTYLLLIEQRIKGIDSPWHAYIACLPGPESMTTPLWFDGEDRAFLTGTSLAPAAQERKDNLYREWEQASTIMKELSIALADDVSFDLLLWAATIFTSRAFISTHILPGRETIPLLFPVVDILNHSVSAKVEWDFQPHSSFALKCLEGETVKAGDELFNNYAPKQNDELLLGYGFCLEPNPIEQFALKLAFPPTLQEYAREMNLLNPENVPFGMSPTFLNTDSNQEQHFLRARGHPFGRYENQIPYFSGIPPYIVHFFFIQSLLARDADVRDVDVQRPGVRTTLRVLVLLYQAIQQRCHSLPLSDAREPNNEKQKYAKIYRDGQAKIIHSIRCELKAAVDKVRGPSKQLSPGSPVLLSIDEAIASLESELPIQASHFRKGLFEHDLQSPDDDIVTWTLLLIVFVSTMLAAETPSDTLIFSWLRDLFTTHPLPALEDGITDAETYAFIDENLGAFLQLPSSDKDASPTDVLDDLGLTFVNQPAHSTTPVFVNGKTENLGVRIVMWAMKVAEVEVMSVLEGGQLESCMYLRPWRDGGDREDEQWIYEDVDIPEEDMA